MSQKNLNQKKQQLTPQALIIGGGVTGTGTARDLALRGVSSIVIEKGNLNDGASGRNHGLLHSGARYVGTDLHAAAECRIEGQILKQIAPNCIEDTGGLFVAVPGDDESYIADFPGRCQKAGIPVKQLTIAQALDMEPAISKQAIAVYQVPDASVDPFHLSLENMNQAIEHGARYFSNCEAISFTRKGSRITKVEVRNSLTGELFNIRPQVVISAAGAWAGMVAAMAGISLSMIYSKGSLLVTHNRLTRHVVNRLRPASDGDILVPGRTVSIFGTTSVRLDSLDRIQPDFHETDDLINQGAQMVPGLETARYIRAYAGVRPLVKNTAGPGSDPDKDDRAVSRGFYLFDHEAQGVDNLVTITGGKVTTFRLMAEKTCDLALEKLGISKACTTAQTPLKSKAPSNLIEAGMSVRLWARDHKPGDPIMCECEMVPESHFKELITWLKQNRETADLNSLRIHSRLGKGACQGTFCSMRVTGFMYDHAYIRGRQGIDNIKKLLCERFKGQRPVLWGSQLAQAELNQAMFSTLFGLDMEPDMEPGMEPSAKNGPVPKPWYRRKKEDQ